MRPDLYGFAGLAILTMTAPLAAAGDIPEEDEIISRAPFNAGWEASSLPQREPQTKPSWLFALHQTVITSDSDENSATTELQLFQPITDDW